MNISPILSMNLLFIAHIFTISHEWTSLAEQTILKKKQIYYENITIINYRYING